MSQVMMMHLHLLFFCGILGATLPPPVFSRAPTRDSSWKLRPSVHDADGQKHFSGLSRSTHHADELLTSNYSHRQPELTAEHHLQPMIDTRANGDLITNQLPVKRHSDAVFTDSYSRFRKQMAARKYLKSMLQGKRKFST